MSSYKKEIQNFLPADELHGVDAVVIDQPEVLNSVTEEPGVTRKATATLFAEFIAASAENTAAINGILSPVIGGVNGDLSAEKTERQNADAALQAQIDLGQGRGGALTAHDFGVLSSELTQEQLIEYACEDIWGAGGTFTFDDVTPSASTYETGGVTHTAAEMFNNTWVRNTFENENHKWVLTNTPDTTPAVYIWTDVGQDVVGDATPDYAGVAKLYNDYTEENTDGAVTQAVINAMSVLLSAGIDAKLSRAGGVMTGQLNAMPNQTMDAQVRDITVSATPLTPGSSALDTGRVYICYE
jgi:hypothetical protein